MGAPTDVGLLCEGSVRFGFLAADNVSFVGNFQSKNTVKFEYNPGAPKLQNRISKAIGSYGSILDQVAIPQPDVITLSFDSMDADALAVMLRGSKSGLTATGATVAPATFAATVLDLWIPIGQKFLSAVTVTNTGATTTYVAGNDYDVDTSGGNIIFYSSGGITLGQSLKVGYVYAAYTGNIISAETAAQLYLSVTFEGKNFANGNYIEINIPKYACSPNGAIDFMSENWAVASLTGSAIKVGANAPMTLKYTVPPTGF